MWTAKPLAAASARGTPRARKATVQPASTVPRLATRLMGNRLASAASDAPVTTRVRLQG